MQVREFAEQVLFGSALEVKLGPPGVLIDTRPGPAIQAPRVPGRPPELRFKPQRAAPSEAPGLHRLDQERERGRLLHFFANHELLATELMALVLLRFPDAPADFRRGVLQTLQDEQAHTRLYLDRMRDCGIEFGDQPLSGYFWRTVSPMESPMDYVTALCLTFEQANLDYCRHFARGFQAAGDLQTARLLEGIYRDEIGHVAYGLKWFRRWKNPSQSDWDAFRSLLKAPLSPQRAKGGMALNVEGRRAAGLEPGFIAELDVYARSKGRTPDVFVFNPFCEAFLAQGPSFTPNRHQARLAEDLANIPQFLSRQDDIVLVPLRPSIEFLATLKQAGFDLPEFVELDGTGFPPDHSMRQRKLHRLRPWAWGPDSVAKLEPLVSNATGSKLPAGQLFNPAIAQLYSKSWSAQCLRSLLAALPSSPWLCAPEEAGISTTTLEGALEAVAGIRARGHLKVVVKKALGLAGQNAIRLWEPTLGEPQRRWIQRAVDQGATLVIEPWLERALDFSVQLEMTNSGMQLRGYTGLINDHRGQYQGNWAGPSHSRCPPSQVAALFPATPDIAARMQHLYGRVLGLLEPPFQCAGYLGPVGVDAFVYRTAQGQARLKPIVEINPRYTMGRVLVELMKRACPGSHGTFQLVSTAQARTEGCASLPELARALRGRFPVRLEGEPVPKIREGLVCLNDPAHAHSCLALFHVSPRAPQFDGPSGKAL